MSIEIILKEYDEHNPTYRLFQGRVESLLKQLIEEKGVSTHSVSGRVKERPSLEKKFQKKGEKYKSITDVTDIVGVRIITFFDRDVDIIAELIKDNFDIDEINSVNKKSSIDPDKFGYLSVHLICKMNNQRLQAMEWRRFASICFEVQIRSILQHAWAEIEHDIGYKSAIEVPRIIKRRFSRVAGLLELADEELSGIKEEIEKYSIELSETVIQSPNEVAIDKNSLEAFVHSSSIILEMDKRITQTIKLPILSESIGGSVITLLGWLGIRSIGDLAKEIEDGREVFCVFCPIYVGSVDLNGMTGIYRGASVFIFANFLAAKKLRTKEKVAAYLSDNKLVNANERQSFAEKIIEVYQKSVNEISRKSPKR